MLKQFLPDGKKVNSIEFKILMCIKDKGIKGANAYQDVCLDKNINVCNAETNTKTAYHDASINYFRIFIKVLVSKNDIFLTQRIALILTYHSLHMSMLNCKT